MMNELWRYLRVRKKYWLVPLVIGCTLTGMLLAVTQGSALVPLLYALF